MGLSLCTKRWKPCCSASTRPAGRRHHRRLLRRAEIPQVVSMVCVIIISITTVFKGISRERRRLREESYILVGCGSNQPRRRDAAEAVLEAMPSRNQVVDPVGVVFKELRLIVDSH